MYVPQPSIVPINVIAFANVSSTIGTFTGDNVFNVTLCVTLILKVVADHQKLGEAERRFSITVLRRTYPGTSAF